MLHLNRVVGCVPPSPLVGDGWMDGWVVCCSAVCCCLSPETAESYGFVYKLVSQYTS